LGFVQKAKPPWSRTQAHDSGPVSERWREERGGGEEEEFQLVRASLDNEKSEEDVQHTGSQSLMPLQALNWAGQTLKSRAETRTDEGEVEVDDEERKGAKRGTRSVARATLVRRRRAMVERGLEVGEVGARRGEEEERGGRSE